MSDVVLCDVDAGIARVVLNRAKALNALDLDMVDALADVMARLERDPLVRVVTVEGAGDHFMAGGDLKFFAEHMTGKPADRARAFESFINRVHPAIIAMRRMPSPIVAKVRGAAAGFGFSLMMACDLAVASEDAYFTTAYTLLGVSPDGGSTWSLPRLVGTKKAMELALLADRFDAQEALRLGIINRVVAPDALDGEVEALAARLAKGPRRAYANTKRLLLRSLESPLPVQLSAEAAAFAECTSTPDFVEGLEAFADKRKPQFGKKGS